MSDVVRVIGLTGPTGSGKSIASEVFLDNGFIVIDADKLAKEIIKKEDVIKEIQNTFGNDVVVDGKIDKKVLAKKAFSSKDEEIKLNKIVHPIVLSEAKRIIENSVFNGLTKFVFDAPLLFESGADSFCTETLSVISPKEIRLKRIMERDHITIDEAERRIFVQNDDDFYIDRSEYVIYNDGTIDELKEEVENIINEE